ncbi:unnamed protein product, partial [Ectocarpus sp. 12 AP-2014]
ARARCRGFYRGETEAWWLHRSCDAGVRRHQQKILSVMSQEGRSAGGTASPQAETENDTGRSIQQLFEATVGQVSRWTGPAVGTEDVRF